jgi:hypothetical protein
MMDCLVKHFDLIFQFSVTFGGARGGRSARGLRNVHIAAQELYSVVTGQSLPLVLPILLYYSLIDFMLKALSYM